jgi:hypothetical protein
MKGVCTDCYDAIQSAWRDQLILLHRECLLAFVAQREASVAETYMHFMRERGHTGPSLQEVRAERDSARLTPEQRAAGGGSQTDDAVPSSSPSEAKKTWVGPGTTRHTTKEEAHFQSYGDPEDLTSPSQEHRFIDPYSLPRRQSHD